MSIVKHIKEHAKLGFVIPASAVVEGGTDVTVQAAVGALTSGRTWKEKVVLQGNFTFSAPVTIPSYTIIEIQGSVTGTSSGNGVFENADATNTDIEIIGGLIDVDNTLTPWNKRGIKFSGVTRFSIRDVRIIDAGSHCIDIIGCNDFLVSGCTLENAADDGISAVYSYDGVITGNRIVGGANNAAGGQGPSGIEIEDSSHDITVSNNVVTDVLNGSATGIKTIVDSGGTGAPYNITITGNIVKNCLTGIITQSSKALVDITGVAGDGDKITVTTAAHQLLATHTAQVLIYNIDDVSLVGLNRPWTATYVDATNFTIDAVCLNYDNEAGGPFTVGETITGAGGATGTLAVLYDAGATGTLILTDTTETFIDEEELTGGSSSATADITDFTPAFAGDGDVYFDVDNCIVSGNTVSGCTNAGMGVTRVRNSAIAGNVISSCERGILTGTGCKGTALNDNTISYCSLIGIDMFTNASMSVQNNLINLCAWGRSLQWVIALNTCTDCVIANNTILGAVDATEGANAGGVKGIQSVSGGTNRIYGNDVTDANATAGVKIQATAGDDCWDNKGATVYTEASTGAQVLPPAYHYVELNNTTTIAATMPASDHIGRLFTVKTIAEPDTAHTITLGSGTWNGTDTVATFADADDKIVVLFDDDGDGVVLLNQGTVVFS